MNQRQLLERMDNRTLYLNLVLTQAILLVVGLVLYYLFLDDRMPLTQLFHTERFFGAVSSGVGLAVLVLTIDLVLMRWAPKDYFDDGGVNKRLFQGLTYWQIFLLALGVAVIEEWLFRAVLQNIIGWFWASLVFALIHVRYWSKWMYALLIVLISFGFGLMYEWMDSIWSVVIAHFLIDFCLGLIIRYRLFSFVDE
jgi:hypothetical protein